MCWWGLVPGIGVGGGVVQVGPAGGMTSLGDDFGYAVLV